MEWAYLYLVNIQSLTCYSNTCLLLLEPEYEVETKARPRLPFPLTGAAWISPKMQVGRKLISRCAKAYGGVKGLGKLGVKLWCYYPYRYRHSYLHVSAAGEHEGSAKVPMIGTLLS